MSNFGYKIKSCFARPESLNREMLREPGLIRSTAAGPASMVGARHATACVTLLAGLCLALAGAGYLFTNRFPAHAPMVLPLTELDRAIPFWPVTGWLYAAQYGFLLWAFLSLRGPAARLRFIGAGMMMQALAMLCFWLWPVSFPRELGPVPADAWSLHAQLSEFWRTLDGPGNCLPSLHAANAVLCVAVFWSHGPARRWRFWAFALGMLCAGSTLTFKQHYVVDVLAGLVLGGGVTAAFFPCRMAKARNEL